MPMIISNSMMSSNPTIDNKISEPISAGTLFYPNSDGYLVDWLLAGPFDEADSWDDFPTNLTDRNHINTSLYYTIGDYVIPEDDPISGSDSSKKWFSYHSDSSLVDLDSIFTPNDYVAGYALVYVYFPQSYSEVYAFLGSDDGVRFIQNGSDIFYSHTPRGHSYDDDKVSLGAITQGWYSFVVLVEEIEGAWRFSLRFSQSASSYEKVPGMVCSFDPINDNVEYANQEYVVLFDHAINSTITDTFNAAGGTVSTSNWENLNGFSGSINAYDLPLFLSNITDAQVYEDSELEIMMNTVHSQLRTYPDIINSTHYNLTGNSNSSIAFIDSGIDISNTFFSGFGTLDYSQDLVGWADFVSSSSAPNDLNGHGTSLAAIAAGGDSALDHNGEMYSLSYNRTINHEDYFYPNHIAPGWYSIKISGFNTSLADSLISINTTVNELTTNKIAESNTKLYYMGSLVDTYSNLNFSYNVSSNVGEYSVFFDYRINFGAIPEFQLISNMTWCPTLSEGNIPAFQGIAPNSNLVSLKILDSNGKGSVSDLLSGLDWVCSNGSLYHVISLVMSFGLYEMESGLEQIISNLIDSIINNGTMVVIAAGNEGVGSQQLNRLATNQKALVIGACSESDQITSYSSQGMNTSIFTKPDLVAPGGSLAMGVSTIQTAGSNTNLVDPDIITSLSGSSVSAAIVGGIFNLFAEYFGGWDAWNTTNGESALFIKSLLIMTATESGQYREDDPTTSFDESNIFVPINRGGWDAHEGYGRINPLPAINALNNSFPVNDSIAFSLGASEESAFEEHAYAINVSLTQNEIYRFNLTRSSGDLDADLYLYSTEHDENGYPILLSNSATTDSDELFEFLNVNQTKDFFVVVKAVSGAGVLALNISQPVVSYSPLLNNSYWEASSDYADLLDVYSFVVNYSHPQNFAPNFVYFRTEHNGYENISMSKVNPWDNDYTNGVLYSCDYIFGEEGVFYYHFLTQTGQYLFNSTNESVEFTLTINNIPNLQPDFYYSSEFDTISESDDWIFTTDSLEITFEGSATDVYTGWDWIQVSNALDYRPAAIDDLYSTWGGMYCGITGTLGIPNTPLSIGTDLLYSYSGLLGTFDLLSPHIFVDSGEVNDPVVELGYRISVGAGESFSIAINSNRTGWQTLQSFTNTEQEWALIRLDLSDFIDTYIQLRFRGTLLGGLGQYNNGFLLDHIDFLDNSSSNSNAPILSPGQDLLFQNLPYYTSTGQSQYDRYKFQVSYEDDDENVPQFVYLELDGTNYTMYNDYGRWNTNPGFLEYKMLYSYELSLFGFENTSYRFHTFDGKYYTSTEWFSDLEIQSITKEPEYNLPFNGSFSSEELLIFGSPLPRTKTAWIDADTVWHQTALLGTVLNENEWYCGIQNYLGYGSNWDISMMTIPIELNGTNEIFLNLSHQLSFDLGTNGGDYAEVLISVDSGNSWVSLAKFEEATTENAIINLSPYMNKNATFRFRFVSDNSGVQMAQSGWRISNLFIDINRTKDYDAPTILFLNIYDGLEVSGIFNVTINITDNYAVNLSRIDLFVDNVLYNGSNFINNNSQLVYELNTRLFDNRDRIEFVVIAYDLSGNRAIEKAIVTVKNPITNNTVIIALVLLVVVLGIVGYRSYEKYQIKKEIKAGTYIPKGTLKDRLEQKRFAREKDLTEVEAVLEKYDRELEIERPYTLHCNSCKTWFESKRFELYCPECGNDGLMIAKKCPICKKWQFFDEEGAHKCKKCKVNLLKDFDLARQEIISRESMHEEENQSGHIDELVDIAKDLSPDELKKLLQNLRKDGGTTLE